MSNFSLLSKISIAFLQFQHISAMQKTMLNIANLSLIWNDVDLADAHSLFLIVKFYATVTLFPTGNYLKLSLPGTNLYTHVINKHKLRLKL